MILLLCLYLLIYLVVAYMSIFKFDYPLTRILRIIYGITVIIFSATMLYGITLNSWWAILLVAALVINVEITAFKHKKADEKGVQILNIFSIMLYILIVAVTVYIFGL